jgi:hypothetical protein
MTAPACGWNPVSASPNCDWDPTCPHHGGTMNAQQRLTAYLCSRPGSENMDAYHADFARQILDQHAKEIAARQSSVRFGRTEGLEVTQLGDLLREDATALAVLDADRIAATDDPLTLIRCLHETVAALTEITPAALTAARLNPDAITSEEGPDVADIYGNITQGLARAHDALRDATDCI